MKIVCLVKQVPRADSIEFDQETKQLRREGVPLLLNPFDAAAVAHAASHDGAEVIAMTMGPPQAAEALKACLALGADRCIHLSDRAFAVADTLGTSRTLALAIEKEGGVALVVCGRKTTDSETWQVPPETAAFLGWPHLTSVVESEVGDGRLRATRETDAGYETWELPTPAVISFAYGGEADGTAEGPIDVWNAGHLVDDLRENDKRFGQTGSPTRVLAVRDVTPQRAGIQADSVEDAVAKIRKLLAERPPGETAWEKPDRLGETPGKSYDSWTFVETIDGRASRTSLELLAKSRELAGKLGGQNVALVLGIASTTSPIAWTPRRRACRRRRRSSSSRTTTGSSGALALVQVLRKLAHTCSTIPATANGRDVGPRAAGELELGMTGDCVNLGIDRAGRLIQTKPAYGGNIVSVIMGATTPQLATVRPRMFAPLEPRDETATVERFELEALPGAQARLVEERRRSLRTTSTRTTSSSSSAPNAPATGSNGASVGGTRDVVRARRRCRGNRQIGLYGRPVAPPRARRRWSATGDFEELTGIVKSSVIVSVDGGAEMEAQADVDLPPAIPATAVAALLRALMELNLHEWGDPAAPPVVCSTASTHTGAASAGLPKSGSHTASACSHPTSAATAAPGGNRPGRSRPTRTTCSRRSTRAGVRRAHMGRALVRRPAGARARSTRTGTHRAHRAARPGDPAACRTSASTSPNANVQTARSTRPRKRSRRGSRPARRRRASISRRRCASTSCSTPTEVPLPLLPERSRLDVRRALPLRRRRPRSLRVPTLLVHAGEFGLVREDQIEAYRGALGDLIEVVEVPGGHIVYWDAYERDGGRGRAVPRGC